MFRMTNHLRRSQVVVFRDKIGHMTISSYHQQFQAQSDQEVQNKANAKEAELLEIFSHVKPSESHDPIKVAVLGCGDKRLVAHHRVMFSKLLNHEVELTTFDLTAEHLAGEDRVFEHDCTLPLPFGHFNITYAHVLMKFIETNKHWSLVKNSYDALAPGGIAIHIFDQEEIDAQNPQLPGGHYAVDLEDIKKKLEGEHIEYIQLQLKYGPAIILKKD